MTARGLLSRGLTELGLEPSGYLINSFMTLLSELKKWSRAYNLTGLHKDEDIVVKHFLDSLLCLKAMPADRLRVADIGSGAGFPGIPIKIVRPDVEMCLIEPSKKKSAFLGHMIRLLDLKQAEVIPRRVEDIKVGKDLSAPVDIAVTRALFDVKEFVKKASPILKRGGILILSKGPKVKDELRDAGELKYDLRVARLPLSQIERYIVVIAPDSYVSA